MGELSPLHWLHSGISKSCISIFPSLYTLEWEQEENIHQTRMTRLRKISWKSKVEIQEMCLIHSGFSMHYQLCYLGVVLKLHRAKTWLWCPNQVIPGGLASRQSMYCYTHCTSAAQFGFETNYNPATGLLLRTQRASLWVWLLIALFQMIQLWERKM